MARFYLLMRSHGQSTRIQVDEDEYCVDHRGSPPMFHTVNRQVDGRPYTFALRCPSSLTRDERSRLFPNATPLEDAVAELQRQERETKGSRQATKYEDMGLLLLLASLGFWG